MMSPVIAAQAPPAARSLRRWQTLTVALMVAGYAGYYLCRSDLSVALPLLIHDWQTRGLSADAAKLRFGTIASLGVVAYAVGKFPAGWIADFLGGRRNFLFGMAGAILFTLVFGLAGTIPLFTVAWFGNRLIQSMGWSGMIKITSKWFSWSSYGGVMGVISLSYLFGDAAAREFLSVLIDRGVGWRGLFLAAAVTLAALLVLNLAWLRETPARLGLPEPRANPANLFEAEGERHTPANLSGLLLTFFRSRAFWLVCVLSLGITLVRETFNLWSPEYFTQSVGLSNAEAARASALFPLSGGLSVLLAGFLGDRLGRLGRAKIILCGMLLAGIFLLMLAFANMGHSRLRPVLFVALIAFAIIGPYSYLSGAIALDFGGKQGSATAAGLIDGVGYLAGVLAGNVMAGISIAWGWRGAFAVLAAVAWTAGGAATIYLYQQRSRS